MHRLRRYGDRIVSLKPRPHQQQCRSNVRLCRSSIRLCCQKTATMSNEFIVNFRPFHNVECCFDIVAAFGNNVTGFGINVERNFVLSTKSKQIKHVQFVSTLSKGRNFVLLPKPAPLLPKMATMWKQHSTLSKELFDL